MKRLCPVLLNYVQVACALLLHRLGFGIWFLFLPIQVAVARANGRAAISRRQLIVLCLHHFVSTAIAHALSYRLYHLFVSSDDLTLGVGRLGLLGGLVIVAALSIDSILHWRGEEDE